MGNTILSAKGISKAFGKNIVLTDITLDIETNEVHAIVGENGAGKSTFIKILAGEYGIDSGTYMFEGRDVTGSSVKAMQDAGLQVIHQNLNLVPSLPVMQNILLGHAPTNKLGILNWRRGKGRAKEVLELISNKIDLNTPVSMLSAAEKQLVIIARAIVEKPKLLILDEPTARLGLEETEQLFRLINMLKESGVSMLYITHRLEEIYRICDKVSVFRDGEKVLTKNISEITEDEIVSAMLGKKAESIAGGAGIEANVGEILLKIDGLKYKNVLKNVSFDVKAGEIVGLLGSVGAGKSETLEIIYGTLRPDGGRLYLKGREIDLKHHVPKESIKESMAMVPEDRQTQGLVLDFVNRENLTFAELDKVSRRSIIKNAKERAETDKLIKKLLVKPDDPEYVTGLLSGGNQQKIAIGKWLISDYQIYLLDEITAGVDVGAKAEIYKIIRDIAGSGSAVLLSTSDMKEAMALCSRFVILHRGNVVEEIDRADANMEDLLLAMMGGKKHE